MFDIDINWSHSYREVVLLLLLQCFAVVEKMYDNAEITNTWLSMDMDVLAHTAQVEAFVQFIIWWLKFRFPTKVIIQCLL